MNTTTTTSDARESDRIARELVAELERAWNAGDGGAYAAPFADDAVFVNILGAVARGRAEIAGGHDHIFRTIYAGSRVHYEVAETRAVGHDLLHVLVRADLQIPAGPLAGAKSAVGSHLLRRTDAGWRSVLFHNTEVT